MDLISLMGINMIPTAIVFGEKYKYFLSEHYKFIENVRLEEGA